jgi:hypothetical protein
VTREHPSESHRSNSKSAKGIARRRANAELKATIAARRMADETLRNMGLDPDANDDIVDEGDPEVPSLAHVLKRIVLRRPTKAEIDRVGRELFGARFGRSICEAHRTLDRAYERAVDLAAKRRSVEFGLEDDG